MLLLSYEPNLEALCDNIHPLWSHNHRFSHIVIPCAFSFSFEQTKLTQFNHNNNTLRYNLVLNTEHNPNKKLSIYYNKVKGRMFYEGSMFALTDTITWLNSFRPYTKSTNRMNTVFIFSWHYDF